MPNKPDSKQEVSRYIEVKSCGDCPKKMAYTTNNKHWCPAIMRAFGFKNATQAEIDLDTLHKDCPLPRSPLAEIAKEIEGELSKAFTTCDCQQIDDDGGREWCMGCELKGKIAAIIKKHGGENE